MTTVYNTTSRKVPPKLQNKCMWKLRPRYQHKYKEGSLESFFNGQRLSYINVGSWGAGLTCPLLSSL